MSSLFGGFDVSAELAMNPSQLGSYRVLIPLHSVLTLSLQAAGRGDVRLGEISKPMQGSVSLPSLDLQISDVHIPLTPLHMERIEELRQAQDLNFKVGVRVALLAYPNQGGEPHTLHLWGEYSKGVPRSQWVEEFLHRLGYGETQIWEVRNMRGKAHGTLATEYERLRKAIHQLDLGHWSPAYGQCREAIDSLRKRKDELGLAEAIDPKAVQRMFDYLSLALHVETAIDTDWEPDRDDAAFAVSSTKAILDRVSGALHAKGK